MILEVIDRHSEALFESLWCPVCGQEVFTHIPFEGVFCKNCNTRSNSKNPERHAATKRPCSPASIHCDLEGLPNHLVHHIDGSVDIRSTVVVGHIWMMRRVFSERARPENRS